MEGEEVGKKEERDEGEKGRRRRKRTRGGGWERRVVGGGEEEGKEYHAEVLKGHCSTTGCCIVLKQQCSLCIQAGLQNIYGSS